MTTPQISRKLFDDEVISFGHCICGMEPTHPTRLKPSWAVSAGWEGSVMFDESRTRLPDIGETCRLRLTFPFFEHVGDAFWFLVRADDLSRPLEADDAGAVAGSAMIRVRTITATMHPPSPESPYGHAEATAVVLEAVGMNELLRLPAREGRTHPA